METLKIITKKEGKGGKKESSPRGYRGTQPSYQISKATSARGNLFLQKRRGELKNQGGKRQLCPLQKTGFGGINRSDCPTGGRKKRTLSMVRHEEKGNLLPLCFFKGKGGQSRRISPEHPTHEKKKRKKKDSQFRGRKNLHCKELTVHRREEGSHKQMGRGGGKWKTRTRHHKKKGEKSITTLSKRKS